jgi:hypothetical protein
VERIDAHRCVDVVVLADGLEVGRAHVGADRLDRPAALFAEVVEEAGQHLGGLAWAGVDDLAEVVVGDQRQVVVLLAVAHLVHAHPVQPVQSGVVELVGHDPFDDRPDGTPVDPAQLGDRGLVAALRQPRHDILEVAREPGTVTGERHGLHHDPTGVAPL